MWMLYIEVDREGGGGDVDDWNFDVSRVGEGSRV